MDDRVENLAEKILALLEQELCEARMDDAMRHNTPSKIEGCMTDIYSLEGDFLGMGWQWDYTEKEVAAALTKLIKDGNLAVTIEKGMGGNNLTRFIHPPQL